MKRVAWMYHFKTGELLEKIRGSPQLISDLVKIHGTDILIPPTVVDGKKMLVKNRIDTIL